MKNRLDQSAGIVVGANSYVGLALFRELQSRGATRLVGTFLPRDRDTGVGIDEVSRHMSGLTDFTAMELDQTDDEQVKTVIREAQETMNGLDLLVTAASLQSEKAHLAMSFEEMCAQVQVNLLGTMNVIRHAVNKMISLTAIESPQFNHRSIGVVASIRGLEPLVAQTYDAAKAGLVHHVRALSTQIGQYGISINAVAPGTIDCPIEYVRHGCSQVEYQQRWAPLTPYGGTPVTPEDVAEELVHLMNSGSVTGHTVPVDGGFSQMRPLPQRKAD